MNCIIICKDVLTSFGIIFIILNMNIKQLNNASPIPLYRQLADVILQSVRSGSYKPGEKIPSETLFAENFGIGRPTVRQATELLIRKGVLKRIRGSGTFVKEEQKDIDLFSIAGTSSAFSKKGINISLKILKAIIKITENENVNNPFYKREPTFYVHQFFDYVVYTSFP